MQSIYEQYKGIQFVGTHRDSVLLASLQPIPPYGEGGRQNWKTSGQPFGPIGLLLQSTHNIAATLDLQDGIVRKSGCVQLSLLRSLWQYFKATAIDFAARALVQAESQTRT
eukprot:2151354-Karenia_brevis.AAC.1